MLYCQRYCGTLVVSTQEVPRKLAALPPYTGENDLFFLGARTAYSS